MYYLSCGNNYGEAKYKQLWETNNKPIIRSNHMYQRTLSEVYKLKPGVGGIFWEKKEYWIWGLSPQEWQYVQQ